MQVLYADVLFFINFFMDILALSLAGAPVRAERRPLRIFLAAVVGSAYAVLDTVFPTKNLISMLLSFFVSVLMTYIAYGAPSFRRFLGLFLWFYAVSLLLGGAVTTLFCLFSNFFGENTLMPTRPDVLVTLAGLSGILIAAAERFFTRRTQGERIRLLIGYTGKEFEAAALVDSGNLLTDPISGAPVILVTRQCLLRHLPNVVRAADGYGRGMTADGVFLRPVFVSGVEGNRMLYAFTPTVLYHMEGKRKRRLTATLALDDRRERYGDCDALCPATLVS